MSAERLTGRELKRLLAAELAGEPFGEALERIGRLPPRRAVSPLFGLFCSREPIVRWRAVTAMGTVVSRLATDRAESARVVMRRCMWNLNEESGGIGWGCAEAMGDSLARSDVLACEYGCILLAYLDPKGNFIDHPALQEGVVWGAGRLVRARPEFAPAAVDLLLPFLSDPVPALRGLAAWAAAPAQDHRLATALAGLAGDAAPFELYEDGRISRPTVGAISRRSLSGRQ
jgi:HEAT repeat protein